MTLALEPVVEAGGAVGAGTGVVGVTGVLLTTLALQLADDPPFDPAQLHDHGPVPETVP